MTQNKNSVIVSLYKREHYKRRILQRINLTKDIFTKDLLYKAKIYERKYRLPERIQKRAVEMRNQIYGFICIRLFSGQKRSFDIGKKEE